MIHRSISTLILRFTALAACGFATNVFAQSTSSPPTTPLRASSDLSTFASQVDLIAFGQLAVHVEGRVKTFDSHARAAMQFVSGSRTIEGRSAAFTYLDMMLRPASYADVDAVYFKQKQMRAQVAQTLREGLRTDMESMAPEMRSHLEEQIGDVEKRLDEFTKTGLISQRMLADPRVQDLLSRLSTDVLRSAKFVEAIQTALNVMDPEGLRMNLKLVPPVGVADSTGSTDSATTSAKSSTEYLQELQSQPWMTLDDLADPRAAAMSDAIDADLLRQLVDAWTSFTSSWQSLNAEGVNAAAAKLVELLPKINPAIYPDQSRLSWESWYFRAKNMTWVWLIYAFAIVPLLASVIYRWPAARWLGLFMFLMAFAFHTFAVMLRWYVADRWPNSNMFEAVTTAAWFGGCLAIVMELFVRRLPMRNLFALGSTVASMTALMAVHFLPLQLNANISNKMPVLNDVWLYIHTNVIIFSYCLIFIAAVVALLYLITRTLTPMLNLILGYRIAISVLLGIAVSIILATSTELSNRQSRWIGSLAIAVAFAGLTVVSRARLGDRLGGLGLRFIEGPDSYARVGGAGSLILTRPDGSSYLSDSGGGGVSAAASGKSTFGMVLDGTTMVLMELAFIMLWTGLVMGAIWADHSWGRPWGWDPKEVFALNTFIVFLLLVHVRLKVKDKGLWTAILAVIGASVMLFNWIIINFAISGLHSYA